MNFPFSKPNDIKSTNASAKIFLALFLLCACQACAERIKPMSSVEIFREHAQKITVRIEGSNQGAAFISSSNDYSTCAGTEEDIDLDRPCEKTEWIVTTSAHVVEDVNDGEELFVTTFDGLTH